MIYKCWCPNEGPEECGRDIKAFDEECAANKYAEELHDSQAEYPQSTIVHVRSGEQVKKFEVQWEAVRNYYSYEIEDKKAGAQ